MDRHSVTSQMKRWKVIGWVLASLAAFRVPTLVRFFQREKSPTEVGTLTPVKPRHYRVVTVPACCGLVMMLGVSLGSAGRLLGQNQIALSQPLIVKWRYQTDQTSNLTPAADKTTVFLPLAAGTLIALNAADGKLLWKAEAGGEFS